MPPAHSDSLYTSSIHRDTHQSLDGDFFESTQPVTPHAPAPRQLTPMPDGPLVPPDDPDAATWNVGPDDVTPINDDWPMELPGMFV